MSPSLRPVRNVQCYGCFMFLDKPERPPKSDEHVALWAPKEKEEPQHWQWRQRQRSKDSNAQESNTAEKDALKLLDDWARSVKEGDYDAARQLLSEDAKLITLSGECIEGRDALCAWMAKEKQAGCKPRAEKPWFQKSANRKKWKREVRVTFPSKATHELMQSAIVEHGRVTSIEIRPKYPALAVVMKFATAREKNDDETALAQMAENVEWKAWDGQNAEGKAEVRNLLRQQKVREVKRQGLSEFQAAQVNHQGGCFERDLIIERVDGIKVKGKQKVFVRGELGELPPVKIKEGELRQCWGLIPKIVEVQVITTEEMVDGKWVHATEEDLY